MEKPDGKTIGIGAGIVGIPSLVAVWPILVVPAIENAVAQQMLQTEEKVLSLEGDVDMLARVSDRLYRLLLQDEIDEELEKISELEYKRDHTDETWTPDDQAKLGQAHERLEWARSALRELDE